MITIVILFLVAIASIVVCHTVAKKRDADPVFWSVMAAVFGPLAIPFVFFSKRRP